MSDKDFQPAIDNRDYKLVTNKLENGITVTYQRPVEDYVSELESKIKAQDQEILELKKSNKQIRSETLMALAFHFPVAIRKMWSATEIIQLLNRTTDDLDSLEQKAKG